MNLEESIFTSEIIEFAAKNIQARISDKYQGIIFNGKEAQTYAPILRKAVLEIGIKLPTMCSNLTTRAKGENNYLIIPSKEELTKAASVILN